MSPEQAAGRLDLLGPASDIYSLGATLYTVLTNRAPVRGDDTPEILRKVQAGEIDWHGGQNRSPTPRALVAICQKAMALRPADRYATPLALAEDIEHWLADEPVSAYREPWTKRLARWRRRHHTLVTAAALVVLTLIVGGGVSLGLLERQKTQTRVLGQVDALTDTAAGAVPSLLAELAQPDVAAFARMRVREQWNDPALTDRQRLRVGLALAGDDADVRSRLVEMAQKADDPQEVLLVRDALKAHAGELTGELWQRSQEASLPRVERLRLWAILAILDADGAGWKDAAEPAVNELFAANPLHLGVWQQALAPVRQALLPVLQKAYRDPAENRRQLAAALLADYAGDQPRVLADLLLEADAKQFVVAYAAAASLEKEKNQSGGKAPHSIWEKQLLAELDKKPAPPPVAKEIFKKEGTIAADDAQVKTSGGQTMLAKMFEVTLQAGTAYKIGMASKEVDSFVVVQDGAGKELGFDDDSGGGLNSLLEFTPPKSDSYKVYAASLPNKDTKSAGAFVLTITVAASGPLAGSQQNLASRQANAAVALLRLGQPDKIWPLLKHTPDPSVRSYLVHRLGPQGVDLAVVLKGFEEENDISTRRALLLSLGEYSPAGQIPAAAQALVPMLLNLYQTDPDAGLHAAAAWLLTHWGHKEKMLAIDRELAAAEPALKNRNKSGVKPPHSKGDPTWYVNSQGQTMIVVPGPVEFMMGASASDPDRYADEVQHLRRINRTFALAAHPVTVAQFLKYRKNHNYFKKHAPTPDCPVHGATWFEAAGYCNWLSEQEKIPQDQWCYETNLAGQMVKLKENYLSLTGYRLPTEAEVEYACRAKATTSRYFGDQEELLEKHAWYLKNGQDRSWPVGLMKPNDFGFFDVHGNVWNWCQERYKPYPRPKADEPVEDSEDVLSINNQDSRVLRGGSFNFRSGTVRSSARFMYAPASRSLSLGVPSGEDFTT